MNRIERHMFDQVLDYEVAARMYLDALIARGVRINIDPAELSHDEVKIVLEKVMEHLELRENLH